MKFKTTQRGPVSVISLEGSLMGGPDANELNKKVHGLIRAGKSLVVVDLGSLKVMNSSGLGVLIGCASALKDAGGRLAIANASKKILDIIQISRLSPLLKPHDSVKSAVDALKE
jgi:anti-sigma B factor antagonist